MTVVAGVGVNFIWNWAGYIQGRAEGLVFVVRGGIPPDLTAPPKILTAQPYSKFPQSYRIMYFLINQLINAQAHVYLVNHYFLNAPGKMRK